MDYGHFNLYPTQAYYNKTWIGLDQSPEWLTRGFEKHLEDNPGIQSNFHPIGTLKDKTVYLLNCLDTCFGHVFWKLMNISQHLKSGHAVIPIIPHKMAWLIPDEIKEYWVVDLPLNDLNKKIAGFDQFVKSQVDRFGKVYLSDTNCQPDLQNVEIRNFLGSAPFDKVQFKTQKPQITFILREDRFWMAGRWQESLYLLGRKFKLSWFNSYFLTVQNSLIQSTIKKIKKDIPNVKFFITGIGKSKKQTLEYVTDLRTEFPDEITERSWCEVYSASHVVIGIHGSNMLIPTALSAGFINIIPEFKMPNFGEDIGRPFDPGSEPFLERHLPQFCKPFQVAEHAIEILNNYPPGQPSELKDSIIKMPAG